MSFNFFRAGGKALDNDPQADSSKTEDKRLATEKEVVSAKAETADKKTASEKESNVDAKQETDARQERIEKESNSKVKCRHCEQRTVILYDGDEDEEGEPTVSRMHCLNCGFTFSYFPKFEKEEKKREDGLNWNAGFMILVAMLFTIIAIKGDDGGLFQRSEPTTIESVDGSDSLRSPQPNTSTTDTFPDGSSPVRVLNDAEPFEINGNN